MSITNLRNCNIDYFVDSNPLKIGKEYFKKKICLPKTLSDYSGIIVVCSMYYSDEILEKINHLGLKNEVLIL